MSFRHCNTLVLLTLALVGALAGCDQLTGVGPPAELQPGELPAELVVGDTVDVSVTVRDAEGEPVSGETADWAPASGSVTDSSTLTDGQGAASTRWVLATVADTQTLTVRVASLEATFTAAVGPGALDTLILSPADTTLRALGDSVTLAVAARDAYGNELATPALGWSSSDTAVVTVSATDGGAGAVVVARGGGTATVEGADSGVTGTAAITVDPPMSIASISPSTMVAGDTATIVGSWFPTDTAQVAVTVDSIPLRVLSAADTLLVVELPGPDAFPCAPTAERTLTVTAGGDEASATHPVASAPQQSLAVGESVALFDADVSCAELVEPGTYVLSVFNESKTAGAATSFKLQGTAADTVAAHAPVSRMRIEAEPELVTVEPDPELEGHLRVLEENLRVLETLGAPGTGGQAASRQVAALTVGDVKTFRIPDIEANFQTDYIEVTARAVYVGQYGVVWEDTLAPLAGQMDSVWNEIGTEYDQVMHPVLLEYFGDPLVFDDQLDANGKFFMLFSKTVNDFQSPAVAGFVSGCDFYSRSQCESSDVAEIFYGRVPTTAGSGYDEDPSTTTADEWSWQMRATVIHEVKHLTMYANKLDVNPSSPNWEERGTEEATARLAEEFYGRALQGYGQHDNVGYDASIWCERRVGPSWPSCDSVPAIMIKHYNGINVYLQQPANLSPFGPVRSGDWTYYGSGWQWVRWAIDQSGVPEADFIKPLIREPSLRGPANVADKAGRTVPELLADYTLAFAVDDHPGGTVPDRSALTLPSWDTRDIFQGLYDDHKNQDDTLYPTPWPLEPHQVAGSFEVNVPTLYGGAASIFELTSADGRQLLELLGYGGGTAPSVLGLSIVRIQ